MSSRANGPEESPHSVFTSEQVNDLLAEALDTDPCEPEPFVRLLLILLDHAQEPRMQQALHDLIKSAYDQSIVHNIHLDEYIEAVRQDQDIVEETRTRWLNRHKSEA